MVTIMILLPASLGAAFFGRRFRARPGIRRPPGPNRPAFVFRDEEF